MTSSNDLMRVESVTKRFGGFSALNNVSLSVSEGEILGLIGPNGAGKTTLINVISGVIHADNGQIHFRDQEIAKWPPHKIARLGIARTTQVPRPFLNMTVLENVLCGRFFGSFAEKMSDEEHRVKAQEMVNFVGLKPDAESTKLNLQDRKKLELARSIATDPDIILIDEFMSGLGSDEVSNSISLLREIKNKLGISILWIEHVMNAIGELADRVAVLDRGVKIAEGTFEDVTRNEAVIKAYLGAQTK